MTIRYDAVVALHRLSLALSAGQVVALMGRNGAGKTTLLSALVGTATPMAGRVRLGAGSQAADPVALAGPQLLRRVGLVPQDAGDLLYAESVAQECAGADRDAGAPPGSTLALFDRLSPAVDS